MDTAVIGGGAVGVTVAYDLADRGADVTLYEADEVAAGSSGRAAGICYDAFADRRDAELGRRALERFRELSGGGSFSFEDRPYVWLAREDPASAEGEKENRRAEAIREQVPRMRDRGLNVTLLDGEAFTERFPRLVGHDVAVAAVAEDAGCADPAEYTKTLALMARMADVEIREGVPATVRDGAVVETDDGSTEYDAVVAAAGAHTKRVVADVAPLAVKPYRVQAMVTESADASPPMLYDATNGYYLRPYGDGLFVGNGTEPVEQDPDEWKQEADEEFVLDCTEYQERSVGWSWPADRSWAGLCTATPDGDPLVGELADGVFVATGWQGHGFMRAPAVGERLAAQVLGDDAAIEGFGPSRFTEEGEDCAEDIVESFDIVEGMDLDAR